MKSEMVSFSHMARHMHCLPVLLIIKFRHSSVQRNMEIQSNFHKNKISKQYLCLNTLQTGKQYLCLNTLQTGKQCLCTHKHEKTPEPPLATRVLFWLVEAPPQSPANTKCVLERSPSDRGYTILRIAISHNMNPVGFLLVFVHRLQAALRSFSNAESSS